jgi:transposase
LKGTPYRVVQTSKRSERWSILPAIKTNGYLDYDIFQGSINTDRFIFFIRQLLRKINKRPRPRLILIIDNFGIYLLEDLKEIYNEVEVDLVYLALYLLDLSPIKELFNGLKQ